MPGRRHALVASIVASLTVLLLITYTKVGRGELLQYVSPPNAAETKAAPGPKYLPKPSWIPLPIKDPFPALAASTPPPVPTWNAPKRELHKKYGINYAPPLLIGFTRTWPILLQAVVSYITAGWPPEQIHVIENTGAQRANEQGKLSLQNPFHLDYAQLKNLGVNIIRTPVLMNFAQLQNFYIHLSHEHNWPFYFWSHMDVLVLSYEDGLEGVTPGANKEGYKTVYELCLTELRHAMNSNERWAEKFFAYDHLTLVNREAYDDVGGWDTFIPYYLTDCDMYSRLRMRNWTQNDAKAGIIIDVNTVLDDFQAFYRNHTVEPAFRDPNPPDPKPDGGKRADELNEKRSLNDEYAYYKKLKALAEQMRRYKLGDRGRNTWQVSQVGGQGEPFYYPSRGIAEAIDLLTEAGREVYRRKWGHRDCDLIESTILKVEDQWLVAKDWD
ncbi:hypothetical protein VFPPC_12548 [Pochonia chlamydosporia 170]|uniref:Glycosyl transferase family 8 protein n=1 Tax=Pochonia chlamydosporia 170 TaxID=1380566 RepID=A0A179EWS0_METCM|nr:hypothetical protein VFPPC_12548 [Pochonia chlamydosporia 170]OAQ57293.1 hypothetical protein VFPPC_12548 [Pochonia chlamydosporia 170]